MSHKLKVFIGWTIAVAIVSIGIMFWRADNERKRVGGVKFLAEMAEDDAKKAAAEKAEKDLDASQRREYLDAMHAGTVELRRIADELARLQKPK